eukprot:UN09315
MAKDKDLALSLQVMNAELQEQNNELRTTMMTKNRLLTTISDNKSTTPGPPINQIPSPVMQPTQQSVVVGQQPSPIDVNTPQNNIASQNNNSYR